MKVTIIQSDIIWGQPELNRHHLQSLLEQSIGNDLYVFPEMFTTGFVTQPLNHAEQADYDATLCWMQAQAERMNAALAGSVAVREVGSNQYFNRFYFTTPKGHYWEYDKRHLFSYGGEQRHYTAGHERVVVEWRGVKFLLQICYDLRFPVFSRQVPSNRYDVILYVANWPQSRQHVWNTLLQARAIENQCYVVGVNRVGNDKVCHYTGGSMIVNPYGQIVTQCKMGEEGVATAELDLVHQYDFQRKFPMLDDADDFSLRIV